MVNKVRSRPNHYELLGLAPAAESAEVHRAFVAKMSSFGAHSIEEAAQFLVAYETLRDREKRRSYDASLGLLAKPAPREWSIAVTPPRWTPFMVKVPTNQPPEPQVSLDQSREVPGEPEVASPAVQSGVNEPSVEPAARYEAQQQERAQKIPHEDLEVVLKHIRDVGRAERERMRHADSAPSDWRRVGLALGGLLVGAAILGTMAGLSVQDKSGAAQAEPARAPAERAPKPETVLDPSPPTSTAALAGPATEELPQAITPVLRRGHRLFRERHSARQRMAQSAAAESAPSQDRAPEGAALSPAPQPDQGTAADLPVSTKLIARTIERIGYRCGDVSSAAPAEGKAQGVYRITCSSGQTYQATPVRGRYHFRRLGS
jgi:hypothetical protein